MLADGKPIPIRYWQGDKVVDGTVNPPRFFRGMQELHNALRENGIEVYVMTAAHEARAARAVRPEVRLQREAAERDRRDDAAAQPGDRRADHLAAADQGRQYDEAANRSLVITPFLMNPMTWYEGKLGSIVGWIDQWKKPVLVAGDTPTSDGYMLLNATDVARRRARVGEQEGQADGADPRVVG